MSVVTTKQKRFQRRPPRLPVDLLQQKRGVELLAEFLSQDFQKVKPAEANTPLDQIIEHLQQDSRLARTDWRKTAIDLQSEVRRDIISVIEPRPLPPQYHRPSPKASDAYSNIYRLVNKLNSFKWQIRPYVDPRSVFRRFVIFGLEGIRYGADLKAVRIGKEDFFVLELPPRNSARDTLYWLLYSTLRTGDFGNLKICPQCGKFFAHRRRLSCSGKCKMQLNNKKRRWRGEYIPFNKYIQELRKEKREKALKRARQMLKVDKPLREVKRLTGLGDRILKRAGLI